MSTCPICVEKINKSQHKPIVCFHCENMACLSCVRRYILDNISDAKCMFCNVQWDRRFMVNNLTKTFSDKTYRSHRHDILFERCKCLLSILTPILSLKHNQNECRKSLRLLMKERSILSRKIQNLETEITNISRQITRNELAFVREQTVQDDIQSMEIQRPCITPECLGFLDSKGFCPICKNTTCLHCNITKPTDIEHVCREEDKLNWQNMKKTTKPCPSCRVRIFKVTGCDQMWCTHCNTAFSWSKGTIENGSVHNPHYFDWLFDQTRHENEINTEIPADCDENNLPNIHLLRIVLREHEDFSTAIISRYRTIVHVKEVEIPILQGLYYNPHNLTTHQIYRLKLLPYLYNITKSPTLDSRRELERFDYQFMCNVECVEIVNTYVRQQTYLFHQLVKRQVDNHEFIENYDRVKNFFLNALTMFEKEYKRKYKKIKMKL